MTDRGSKSAQQEDSKLQWSQKIAADTMDKKLTGLEERSNRTAKTGKKKSHTRCTKSCPSSSSNHFHHS